MTMHTNFQIDILLSTYQSERFLREQLDSLIRQTMWPHIRLLVRDDGSRDTTPAIVQEYCRQYPDQIVFSASSGTNRGFSSSFGKLLEESRAPYVMFCDHDDVWLPRKVEAEYEAMKEMEKTYPGRGCLIYTDLVVTDEQLHECSPSKFTALKQRHAIHDPACVMICNVLSGCTMMINRPLIPLLLPFPPDLLMHDSYIHIAAAVSGAAISFVPGKWILWRQTGRNESAAGSDALQYRFNLLRKISKEARIWKSLLASCRSLAAKTGLTDSARHLLLDFAGLPEKNRIAQFCFLFRYGRRNLSFITLLSRFLMLLMPEKSSGK